MTLEQLQSMSDMELNTLAAVKVMGWRCDYLFGEKVVEGNESCLYLDVNHTPNWNPARDMNDAMKVLGRIKDEKGHINLNYAGCMSAAFWNFQIIDILPTKDGEMPDVKEISVDDNSPSRAITIAAILAKDEGN